jgi:hypothetical protein
MMTKHFGGSLTMMKPKNTKELGQSSMFPATKLCPDMALFVS